MAENANPSNIFLSNEDETFSPLVPPLTSSDSSSSSLSSVTASSSLREKESSNANIKKGSDKKVQTESWDKVEKRKTFNLWVAAVVLLIVGTLLVIFALVFFFLGGSYTPLSVSSPTSNLTQGFIMYSYNQSYFMIFGTEFSIYEQGARINEVSHSGKLLWTCPAPRFPPGSFMNFTASGSIDIISPQGVLLWSNKSELNPERPPGPYNLMVSDDGYIVIKDQATQTVVWQRPTPDFYELPTGAIPLNSTIEPKKEYSSSSSATSYMWFDPDQVTLSLIQGNTKEILWSSPPFSETALNASYTAPFSCQFTILANLQIVDASGLVVWSTQTARLLSNDSGYIVVDEKQIQIVQQSLGQQTESIWSSISYTNGTQALYSLSSAERLGKNQRLLSRSSESWLAVDEEGLLVLGKTSIGIVSETQAKGDFASISPTSGSLVLQTQSNEVSWSNNVLYDVYQNPITLIVGEEPLMLFVNGKTGLVLGSLSTFDQSQVCPSVQSQE